MKLIATILALTIFLGSFSPAIYAQNGLTAEEIDLLQAGNTHAPTNDAIKECGAVDRVTPGLVYILTNDIIAGTVVENKIREYINSDGWSVEILSEPQLKLENAKTLIKDAENIGDAKHFVLALGAYDTDPDVSIRQDIPDIIGEFKSLATSLNSTHVVNIGSNADGKYSDGSTISDSIFNSTTPKRFSTTNTDISQQSAISNYKVIDWYRAVFGEDANPLLVDPALKDEKDYLIDDKLHISETGAEAFAQLLAQTLTGSANVINAEGDVDLGSNTSITPDQLEGHVLPATQGGSAVEGTLGADGKLKKANSAAGDVGNNVAFPNHAKTIADQYGEEALGYYITMRWRYRSWSWNGSSNSDASETASWYSQAPRRVLVTNPETGKSIITFIAEAGPAPWTGTVEGENNAPSYWQGFVEGTPQNYSGRVSGLPKEAMDALGATQWMYGGPDSGHSSGGGSKLIYQWAPDQSAKPGPTGLSSSSLSCITGSAVDAGGRYFPVVTTKSAIAVGSSNSQGTLKWNPNATSNYHHDYNAADIHVHPGTPVIAMRGGRVASIKRIPNDPLGGKIQINGVDPTTGQSDGFTYYYAHMYPESLTPSIKFGDIVPGGQLLGQIGSTQYAANTAPHLHIDMLPNPPYDARVGCSGESCKEYPFVDIQPILAELYKGLPE